MTAKQLRGYKVLRLTEAVNIRGSSVIRDYAYRIYKPRRKTIPAYKAGPLCVFTDYTYALKFKNDINNFNPSGEFIIVPCLYKKSKETKVWRTNEFLRKDDELEFLPPGTALADSVTCLE